MSELDARKRAEGILGNVFSQYIPLAGVPEPSVQVATINDKLKVMDVALEQTAALVQELDTKLGNVLLPREEHVEKAHEEIAPLISPMALTLSELIGRQLWANRRLRRILERLNL